MTLVGPKDDVALCISIQHSFGEQILENLPFFSLCFCKTEYFYSKKLTVKKLNIKAVLTFGHRNEKIYL